VSGKENNRMDQKRIGSFLRELRTEKKLDAGATCRKAERIGQDCVTLGKRQQYA